jgi:hypothetical protein
MKKYKKISLTTGVVIGALVTIAGSSFAANDFDRDVINEYRFQKSHVGSGENKVKREVVKKTFEANDYEAFKKAVGEKRAKKITQEIFTKMVQMHEAKELEDEEAIDKIKLEFREMGFEGNKRGGHKKFGKRTKN